MAKVDALGGRTGRYYTDSVASGAEDYYAGRGEAAGRWIGQGAVSLDLAGEAATADFHAVLNGREPRDKTILRSGPRASNGEFREGVVRGFDLTFSAPKSVSVLWAAADDSTARQVRLALDTATADALQWLEREACVVRRGKGGVFEFAGGGFIGVAFRHRTSRGHDPQLHTHVVVSNMAKGPDDRWTALRGTLLYRNSRTAGFVFQAVLRDELTRRLGVRWIDSPTPGVGEIDGVPKELCEAFSSRRRAIEEALAGLAPSATSAQVAALATRPAKRAEAPESEIPLREQWRQRALAFGFDREAVDAVLRQPRVAAEIADDRLDHELTAERSTFDRGDVVRHIAQAAHQGAPLSALVDRTDAWLGGPEAIPLVLLSDGAESRLSGAAPPTSSLRSDRWTTRDQLAVERGLVDRAMRLRGVGAGVVDGGTVEQVLAAAPTATEDQRRMVRELCTRGDGLHVVRASAGAGKTWTLDLARQAWELGGHPVVGVAQARRAALELREQAGMITATSIAALEAGLNRHGDELPRGVVLVVDEAAMVGTRTIARLAERTERASGMLVLCGDDHQIREIAAGGAFSGLARRLGATTLTGNRRQRTDHEQLKERLLRLAVPEAYLRTSTEAGELVFCSGAQDARELLVAQWLREHGAFPAGQSVMLAHARDDVDWLNEVARGVLRRTDGHRAETLTVEGREFAPGDWVIARRNWPGGQLVNGLRGTVTAVNPVTQSVEIAPVGDTNDRVNVPRTYLAAGHLHHAYALTAHLAQGMTVERVAVLGSASPERGWTYSALTRHRDAARMYVVAPPALRPEIPRDLAPELDPEDVVGRDGSKALALDTLPSGERATGLDELRERLRDLEKLAGETLAAARELTAAEHHLAEAQAGVPDALSKAAARRWTAEVSRLRNEPLVTLDGEALKAEARSARQAFEERLDFETSRAVAVAATVTPRHVRVLVGERPDDPAEARVWERAVWRIQAHRLRHLDQRARADHPQDLGPAPTRPDERRDFAATQAAISRVQHSVEREHELAL